MHLKERYFVDRVPRNVVVGWQLGPGKLRLGKNHLT